MNATAVAKLDRLPHQATRAVVEALGHEAPRALYRAFDTLNAVHFGGKLGAPLLFVTQTASPRALGDYCGRDVHGLRSRIRIAPKALGRGDHFATDVLLHEMVHAWASEVLGDDEPGYKGHGPKFAAQCNAIGAALGLPPVGVKGRGGLPDCAQWPMCVRPAGYYPPEAAPAPRAPKSPRHRADREGATPEGDHTDRLASVLAGLVAEGARLVAQVPEDERQALGLDDWLRKAERVAL